MKMMTLYRPVNQVELDLIQESGMKRFPPRLAQQPIFYPVTNLEYARQITNQWNKPAYGNGYVVKFQILEEYIKKYPVQNVGGIVHDEYWVPAEELEEFNKNIVGLIEIIE